MAADGEREAGAAAPALLIDWGGVLTTNLFASFHAYCVRAEIDPQKLRRALQQPTPRRASC